MEYCMSAVRLWDSLKSKRLWDCGAWVCVGYYYCRAAAGVQQAGRAAALLRGSRCTHPGTLPPSLPPLLLPPSPRAGCGQGRGGGSDGPQGHEPPHPGAAAVQVGGGTAVQDDGAGRGVWFEVDFWSLEEGGVCATGRDRALPPFLSFSSNINPALGLTSTAPLKRRDD